MAGVMHSSEVVRAEGSGGRGRVRRLISWFTRSSALEVRGLLCQRRRCRVHPPGDWPGTNPETISTGSQVVEAVD